MTDLPTCSSCDVDNNEHHTCTGATVYRMHVVNADVWALPCCGQWASPNLGDLLFGMWAVGIRWLVGMPAATQNVFVQSGNAPSTPVAALSLGIR